MKLQDVLKFYKTRLTNLSQRNRTLRLSRLSPRRDFDLASFSYLEGESDVRMVEKILRRHKTTLIGSLSNRVEELGPLDNRLTKIYRELRLIEEENGTYSFFLGYPFVKGKFADGTLVRAPLMLFPVRLERHTVRTRWSLSPREEEDTYLNSTFFLAWQKFNNTPFPEEFWEGPDLEQVNELADFWPLLQQWLKAAGLDFALPSENIIHLIKPFQNLKVEFMRKHFEPGVLQIDPSAVLGIFPQSDASLMEDFKVAEEAPGAFPLEKFLFPEDLSEAHEPPQEQVPPSPEKTETPTAISEKERFFPLAIDAAQEAAALHLKAGGDLVIHGPPGTGKSQFIVNTVVDYLARGKSVLVVSQKRAALDVVYNRLHKAGLGDFAFLIHDHRNDRRQVFAHLAKLLEQVPRYEEEFGLFDMERWRTDYESIAQRMDEFAEREARRVQAMRSRNRFGFSLYELYAMAPTAPGELPVREMAGELHRNNLEETLHTFEQLLLYPELLNTTHPLYHRPNMAEWGSGEHDDFDQQLQDAISATRQLQAIFRRWRPGKEEPYFARPGIFQSLDELNVAVARINADEEILQTYLRFAGSERSVQSTREAMQEMATFHEILSSLAYVSPVDKRKNKELRTYLIDYKENDRKFFKFLSGKYRSAKRFLKAYLEQFSLELNYSSNQKLENELDKQAQTIADAQVILNEKLFTVFRSTEAYEQWLAVIDTLETHLAAIEALEAVPVLQHLRPDLLRGQAPPEELWRTYQVELENLNQDARTWQQLREKLQNFLYINDFERLMQLIRDDTEQPWQLLEAKRTALQKDFAQMREVDRLFSRLTPAAEEFARSQWRTLANQSTEEWQRQLTLDTYFFWIEKLENEFNEVQVVSARNFPNDLNFFALLRERQQQSVRDLVNFMLRKRILANQEKNRLGNPVTYRNVAHQVNKKRRIWSIRKLVEEEWEDALQYLMPCVLASPETVSAIFPMEANRFDLVLFDEASQCTVERALPAALRGRQVAIAGDEKQLPPFDLFSSHLEEEVQEEDPISLEADSILNLGRQSFPDRYLTWHYRSETDQLIAFSNHHFYDDRLQMVPPATVDEVYQPALKAHYIAAGIWKDNCNLPEAKAVVDAVEEYLTYPEPPTLGVVTFNRKQQAAIQDEIDRRLEAYAGQENPEAGARLRNALERTEEEAFVGLFVKNIENVQGDERDVILFSFGYGKDEAGKFRANFGLLNRKGGENRLNVAITRAKKQVLLFHSFQLRELEVDHLKHRGPKLLKQYLRFAIEGERFAGENREAPAETTPAPPNILADSLAEALDAAGISYQRGVGQSGFSIDIVVYPPGGSQPPLAVVCEGPQFLQALDAKDRFVYRIRMLEAKGWRPHILFARNWWLNPEGEVERLRSALQKPENQTTL